MDVLHKTKCAPDAIVIGAMRAGTTALYRSLMESQLVAVPEAKETDYYLTPDHLARGGKWYRSQFRNSDLPWIDICPNYTKRDVFPGAVTRVHENAPDAKLVFIARDPVMRAVSQYNHTFMHRASIPAPSELLESSQGEHILKVSKYAYQLQPYFERWSAEDILIVDFDEFLETPETVLVQIMKHVGVENVQASPVPTLNKANSGDELRHMPRWWGQLRETQVGQYLRARAPRKLIDRTRSVLKSDKPVEIPSFDRDTKARLAELLRPDAERFRKMTGRTFAHWSV